MDILKELLVIEEARRDAWLTRDKAALATVLDDEFLEINYCGRLSKRDVLDDLFERLVLEKFTIESPSIYGSVESPVLVYSCVERLTIDGEVVEGAFNVASHYGRRGPEGWKILVWQITPCRSLNGAGDEAR